MKAAIAIVGSLAVVSAPALSIVNNLSNYGLNNYHKFNQLHLAHSIETKSPGTHEKDDISKSFYATTKLNWYNDFLNVENVKASGVFELRTKRNPQLLYNINLDFISDKSNSTKLFWKSNDKKYTNDVWFGWGHQTSSISLELTATFIKEENLITLNLLSYVYARTAGSVSTCTTFSQVNSVTLS